MSRPDQLAVAAAITEDILSVVLVSSGDHFVCYNSSGHSSSVSPEGADVAPCLPTTALQDPIRLRSTKANILELRRQL